MNSIRSICVFCGALRGKSDIYIKAAEDLGRELAGRGIKLIYGGGKIGVMGAVANAVLAEGGTVIGVIPRSLVEKELAHTGLTELKIVETMHQRKAMMVELAEAFIAAPGGFGTLEELFEVITWFQLGVHRKPCALLNTGDFYSAMLDFLDHMSGEGFLTPEDRQLLIVEKEPARLLESLQSFVPRQSTKWLAIEQT